MKIKTQKDSVRQKIFKVTKNHSLHYHNQRENLSESLLCHLLLLKRIVKKKNQMQMYNKIIKN